MTVTSWDTKYQPAESVWRTADLLVLILALVALIAGAVLRQNALGATTDVTAQGVSFKVPAGSISSEDNGVYTTRTKDGFSVRVESLPMPPISQDDPNARNAWVTTRARALANQRELFQTIGSDVTEVNGTGAAVMEYQYVSANLASVFSSALTVINGYELLVPNGEALYAISLEGPSDKRAELESVWSQIQSSVRFEGQ